MVVFQENLVQIVSVLFEKSPILAIFAINGTVLNIKRSLQAPGLEEDSFLQEVMKKSAVYVSDGNEEGIPPSIQYFKVFRSKGIIATMSPGTLKSETELSAEISRWTKISAWSSRNPLLIAVKFEENFLSGKQLAYKIVSQLWKQAKAAKIVVMLGNDENTEIYQSQIYTPKGPFQVQEATFEDIRGIRTASIFQVNSNQLKVASTVLSPYVYTVNTSNPMSEGLEVMIFSMISKMMNFTFEMVPSPPGQNAWVATVNGQPSGLLGLIHRYEADIMFHGIRLNWERYRFADALDSYYGGSYVWAAPQPGTIPEWRLVFLVFSPVMWVGVLFGLLVTIAFSAKIFPGHLGELVVAIFGITVNTSVPIPFDLFYLRFVISIYMLYIINITGAYQAGLFEMLSKGMARPPYQTAMEALSDDYRATMFPTMLPELVKNEPHFYEFLTMHSLVNFTSDSLGSFRRIVQGEHELRLTIDFVVKYENNLRFITKSGRRLLTVLKERFSPYEAVFYIPRDHPLQPGIKVSLRRLVETGWVIRLIETILNTARESTHLKEVADPTSYGDLRILTLKKLYGVFLIASFMLLSSFLVFLLELSIGYSRKCRNKRRFKERSSQKDRTKRLIFNLGESPYLNSHFQLPRLLRKRKISLGSLSGKFPQWIIK